MAKRSRVSIVKDKVPLVFKQLSELLGSDVLVGIPESTATRASGELNNATIGYLMESGAPGANIPARPFLVPGVRKAAPAALAQLRKAAIAALSVEHAGSPEQYLTAAGLLAVASVKREITTGDFVPLKPATIRNRLRQRGTLSRRAAEALYAELIRSGESPAAAQAAAGIRPLINTAQLLNSITFVVRKNGEAAQRAWDEQLRTRSMPDQPTSHGSQGTFSASGEVGDVVGEAAEEGAEAVGEVAEEGAEAVGEVVEGGAEALAEVAEGVAETAGAVVVGVAGIL
jgi:hypothetical protein